MLMNSISSRVYDCDDTTPESYRQLRITRDGMLDPKPIKEYTDETVNDPAVKRVGERGTAIGDPAITEDEARMEVELADGHKLTRFIEASFSNLNCPLSDRQLEAKFPDQAVLALTASQVEDILRLAWQIDSLDDGGPLVGRAVLCETPELVLR